AGGKPDAGAGGPDEREAQARARANLPRADAGDDEERHGGQGACGEHGSQQRACDEPLFGHPPIVGHAERRRKPPAARAFAATSQPMTNVQESNDTGRVRQAVRAAANWPRGGGAGPRWFRRILLALVLLTAISWIAVPIAVKHFAEKGVSEVVGRPFHIGAV